jgi:hypothetical protein
LIFNYLNIAITKHVCKGVQISEISVHEKRRESGGNPAKSMDGTGHAQAFK